MVRVQDADGGALTPVLIYGVAGRESEGLVPVASLTFGTVRAAEPFMAAAVQLFGVQVALAVSALALLTVSIALLISMRLVKRFFAAKFVRRVPSADSSGALKH